MLLKSLAVGLLVFMTIRQVMPLVGGLTPMDTVLDVVKSHALSLIRNVCVVALILAFADFAVTRKRVTKQLKMTKQEVKDENRNAEGDPLVKGAIRARQLAAARSRMIADVATADVVLVNPTHIAIALQYEPHKGAPRVIARGAGAIATQIRERAAEARIPTVQDIPLARALYVSTEVGQEIPRELFAAVAQILAFVINRKRNGVYGGEHTSPRAGASVPAVNSAARRRRVEARDLATQRREENKRTDTRPAGPPVG